MEYLKCVYTRNHSLEENFTPTSSQYNVVDVYNKKKYLVLQYLDFLTKISTYDSVFHLAEVPLFPAPLIIDVDIKEKISLNKTTLYSEELVLEILSDYSNTLRELLVKPCEDFIVFLLEKSIREESGELKHGFHLHFLSLSLPEEDLSRLHKKIQGNQKYGKYIDDVSKKPWLLYGASKSPELEPFKITKAYRISRTDGKISTVQVRDILIGEKVGGIEITEQNLKGLLCAIMSVRLTENFSLQVPNFLLKEEEDVLSTKAFLPEKRCVKYTNLSDAKIGEIVVNHLCQNRSENYSDWITIGLILSSVALQRGEKSHDFFKSIFHLFSKKSFKYNEHECENTWNSLMRKGGGSQVGLGTLIYFAKEDATFLGKDINDLLYTVNPHNIPLNDYDIAILVKEYIPDLFITHKEFGCFRLDTTIWQEVSGWDNILKKHVTDWSKMYIPRLKEKIQNLSETSYEDSSDSDSLLDNNDSSENIVSKKRKEEILKTLQKLDKKIRNYSPLNNIVKSLFDLYFDEKVTKLFTQKENIAFKNAIFDVKNWKITNPDPFQYHSTRIEHDYIDWNEVAQEHKDFVLDFWEKIFPDVSLRNYCMKNFARFITGQNTFKQFQFWTGTGNNGKSICITLMEYIFGKMSMKIPKSMVCGAPQKQGSANPELYRLKDARLAVVVEVTNNDFLDPGQIKGITGNDTLYSRDLYQKSKDVKEITPMFFPILITNETPIIKRPDDATWGRIRLIPFEAIFKSNPVKFIQENPDIPIERVFKSDPRIPDKLKSHAKYFLSYFMSILFSYPSFEAFNAEEIIPAKVSEGLENFKLGQNILKQYIDENYMLDENSLEWISFTRVLREYNATRPKVHLSIEEVKVALERYNILHGNKMIIVEDKFRGLVRVNW